MSADGDGAPYLPFEGGRFRLAMGLMPLPSAEWIEIDQRFSADLAAKRALLQARHAEVFAALPESQGASAELLALLARHLPHHHPDTFSRAGDRLVNRATAETWDIAQPALHPLDLAGRLVQEDLCLLLSDGGSYRLAAASLCSPARWRLADKIGRPVGAIHDPVPGYGAKLAAPVDRFFALLKPGKLAWRLNWGIVDDPAPFQPVAREAAAPVTAANAGERLWLRVERQTLQRLPAAGAVAFTIRTHITRLDAAIRSPTSARELAAALRDMPADTSRYKRIAPLAPAVLAWLDARAG